MKLRQVWRDVQIDVRSLIDYFGHRQMRRDKFRGAVVPNLRKEDGAWTHAGIREEGSAAATGRLHPLRSAGVRNQTKAGSRQLPNFLLGYEIETRIARDTA